MKAHLSLNALPESRSDESAMRFWWKHIKKHKGIYLIGALGVIGTNAAEVSIPIYFREIIDRLDQAVATPQKTLFILLAILLIQFLSRFVWRRFMAQQTHVVSAAMKAQLWSKARFFKRSRLESDLNPGELMNVAAGDVGSARYIYGFTLVMIIDFIFLLTFCISAMLYVSPLMTAVTMALLPVLPFILNKIAKKEQKAHSEAQAQLSSLSEKVAQATSTVRLQRVSQSQGYWIDLLTESARRYQEKRWTVVKIDLSFFPAISILPLISYSVLISLGLHLVFKGVLSIGDFVAFQSFLFIIQEPLIEIGYVVSEWQRAMASLKRYKRTIEEEPSSIFSASAKIHQSVAPTKLFQAKDLAFTYPKAQNTVFSHINFELQPGDGLGVTGPIGSGKSTLIEILAGFQRGYQGSLKLYDTEIKEASHLHLRKHMAIVPQKPFLFADTLRKNLCIDQVLDDERAYELLNLVELMEDVKNFPKGLDTPLGEWGVNLSGGQKQRLTLARALATRADIFLLDDCLSAVDTSTEEKILKNIENTLGQASFVWIAHRESTLQLCNKSLELKHV